MDFALPAQDSPLPAVSGDTTLLALLWSMPDVPEVAESRVRRLVSRGSVRLVGALRGHGRTLED